LEYVCASNTSFADTDMNNPSNVDITDKKIIPIIRTIQLATTALKYRTENNIGIMLLKIPNNMAPLIFAVINHSILIGATNNRSNERDFLSNVMVTDSMDVVPNRMDIATIPGKTSSILKAVLVFTNIISIHANGKIIPQLIFGGLR
jgi:hypothetical protein